jgi:hypothetical protein
MKMAVRSTDVMLIQSPEHFYQILIDDLIPKQNYIFKCCSILYLQSPLISSCLSPIASFLSISNGCFIHCFSFSYYTCIIALSYNKLHCNTHLWNHIQYLYLIHPSPPTPSKQESTRTVPALDLKHLPVRVW